jgi:hypothetical protein
VASPLSASVSPWKASEAFDGWLIEITWWTPALATQKLTKESNFSALISPPQRKPSADGERPPEMLLKELLCRALKRRWSKGGDEMSIKRPSPAPSEQPQLNIQLRLNLASQL